MSDRTLLLVGSVPLDSAEDVFRSFGQPLGRYLRYLPDGEVGLRRHWISRIHYQVLALHPDIKVTRQPALDEGRERLHPRDPGDSWKFRVKTGVKKIRFGESGWRLGYARDAVNSYFVFRTLRERGILAQHLRFQVSIASPNSIVPPRVVDDIQDLQIIREGIEEALASELIEIGARIPETDLAIQWDCATEVQDAYGAAPPLPREGGIERSADQMRRLAPLVPAGASLGFHFCFGTLGGWPRFAPADLGATIDLVNAMISASARRVDWVHIPLLDRTDDAFFKPLARIQPAGARVFLGAIHNMDRYPARINAARRYFPDFGVAAFCGFGRMAPAELPRVLREHLEAAETAATNI